MPNYRRFHLEGGTYFFTVNTEGNTPIFANENNVRLLGEVLREMQRRWPVDINAIVLLPDHLHSIWSLPPGDADYPTRWAWAKKEFTKRYLSAGGVEQPRSESRQEHRRRGVWQRRYWEHTIEEEEDFDSHFDYVHWNPAKHGYAKCPSEWPHSSFHRWVEAGVYPRNWGCGGEMPQSLTKEIEAGE